MFEQMLKEMFIKIIREDETLKAEFLVLAAKSYELSVTRSVKYVIENDESVQDVICKQATTDIWEAIEDDVDMRIDKAIDNLVIRRAN